MLKRIIIYGASNPDVIKLLAAMKAVGHSMAFFIEGFLDDTVDASTFMRYPVLGGKEKVEELMADDYDYHFVNNVASTMKARQAVQQNMYGCEMFSVIHPAVDTSYVTMGQGVMVAEGVRLGAGVMIGHNCAVRNNAVVSHESWLNDMVFVGPGAVICGRAHVGYGSYIGAGAVIKEGVKVGRNAVVGMGAVVVKDVPDMATVVGNPARTMKIMKR